MTDIKAIHVVHATWCPHCHPTTVEPIEKVAGELGIPFLSYDIDIPEQAAKGDELVRKFGDWSEDYLVPQVFVETKDGKVQHLLTGSPESLDSTKRAVNNLLESPLFAKVKVGVSRRV
jgi:thiol-disulfide isomerase/thioredoxin